MYDTPDGHPQVVLEHIPLAFAGADEIDADDVGVDVGRQIDALHLAPVLGIAEDALGGYLARRQNRLLVVDVVQERVQCLHALFQSALEHRPFGRRNDARDEIERDQALGARVFPVNGEGDAETMECALRLFPLLGNPCGRRLRQPVRKRLVVRADRAVPEAHFVVWKAGHDEY